MCIFRWLIIKQPFLDKKEGRIKYNMLWCVLTSNTFITPYFTYGLENIIEQMIFSGDIFKQLFRFVPHLLRREEKLYDYVSAWYNEIYRI